MKKNKICIYLFAIALLGGIFFSSCKKYPENKGIHLTLAKNRILSENSIITKYTIDNDDSLSLLSDKFKNDISTIVWNFGDAYGLQIHETTLRTTGVGNLKLQDGNKKLRINYTLNNPNVGYNIFSEQTSTWQILKLYKKKGKSTLKIKRKYNGKTYIIQFN